MQQPNTADGLNPGQLQAAEYNRRNKKMKIKAEQMQMAGSVKPTKVKGNLIDGTSISQDSGSLMSRSSSIAGLD